MKKQYSLALGGGAALGLMHIGVIKYIEEKGLKINEVSGTSMGAVVAAFLAMGKSSDFMIDFTKNINFLKFIDFDLKNGLLKGDKIYKKLEEIFGDIKIEDMDIKLKIVSTNIETGKKEVFENGKIIDAIRASISLPGIFKPYKIGEKLYVDGGILNNLPIEVLGGKNVIGVSVIKNIIGELKTKRNVLGLDFSVGFFNLNYQILQRSLLLMMKQNEESSIKTIGKEVTLIKPECGENEFYSFNKLDDLVNRGYN